MKKFVLDVPFEWRPVASMHKAKWNAAEKVCIFEGETLPELLKPFVPHLFSWEWHKEQHLNKTWNVPQSAPIWSPRPHQTVATTAISLAYKAKSPGFLLADDVGLGKTISAWSFLLEQKKIKTILIVAPLSVLAHWRNTIMNMGHDNRNILIMNYEQLGKLFETKKPLSSSKATGKLKRLAREGAAPSFDLIIYDESHKCKNITSARSKLSHKLTQKAHFVIWASATAGQTPLELAYLTPLLAYCTKSTLSSMNDFEKWCQQQGLNVTRGDYGKWMWDGSPEDIAKIKGWLFNEKTPRGIRRQPSEIIGWKEMERQLKPIELDSTSLIAYYKEWDLFQHEEMEEHHKKKNKEVEHHALVRRLRFRQKSSWLRIPSTVETILEYLDNGVQVAVSVAFHDTLNELVRIFDEKKIKTSSIHGKMNAQDKEQARLQFQKEETSIIFFTVEEGISLHQGEHGMKPRVLLVHDIRWSAIQMAQVEGRCHRDGYFAPSIWLIATNTIDTHISKTLIQRIITMKNMMGDDTSLNQEIEQIILSFSNNLIGYSDKCCG